MAKKRFNTAVAILLSGCVVYWLFFLLNIATGLFNEFFGYHVSRDLSFIICTVCGFLFMILLCISSRDYIKQNKLMLAVFPADIIRLFVYANCWNWFDRADEASQTGMKAVIIVTFAIWLVFVINFIYRIFKNSIEPRKEIQVVV